MRLTLRTLLAYLDDTLPPDQTQLIGQKVAESETARDLIDRLRKITRRRGLSAPAEEGKGTPSDPNKVAEYLSDALPADQINHFEQSVLDNDPLLAEVAACHQILTLLLSEPVRVPPTARRRMYGLVTGPESLPKRKPGKAVPVGGLMPDDGPADPDDADAQYLMGMTAYSASASAGRRAGTAALAGGLLAALAMAAYFAWPTGTPVAQAKLSVPPPALVAEPPKPDPKPAEVKPPENPMLPPAPPGEAPADAEATPPVEPPPMPAAPPAVAPPANDRVSIGKLENAADAVLLMVGADGNWMRVGKAEPGLFTADRLMALPGYKAKATLDGEVSLDLWGNMPEQAPVPVLEAAVTLHPPAEGLDADLTLHTGRVYFQSKKPGGGTVRVRVDEQVWDVKLADARAEVAVELTRALARGLTAAAPAGPPQAAAALAVVRGAAVVRAGTWQARLADGEQVSWQTGQPTPIGPIRPARRAGGSVYFAKFPVPTDETIARPLAVALNDLARGLDRPDAVKVKFAEMLQDTPTTTLGTLFRCRLAVLGSAAIGDLPTLTDALIDANRPFVRDAAVAGLVELVAAAPDALDRFRQLLTDKLRLTDEQAKTAVRLLRGPTDAERADPAVLDTLVELLASRAAPVLRQIAFWVLKNEIDPDAAATPRLVQVDVYGPPDRVDEIRGVWKRRVDDLKKKAEQK